MLNLGKTLQKFPLMETSPTYKHIWQDLQCSNNHRTSLVLHYSDSLLLTVLQLSSQIQESPYNHISPTFTQRWGGYDERLLFGDNRPDNLPTRGRANISFSSALLLSNTVLERKRQMLLTRIIKQGKDEKHWLTSTAGTPSAPLTWLWDVTVLYPLIIHWETHEAGTIHYMLALPCWQNRLSIHTHFCGRNMQMETWNVPIMHCTKPPAIVVQRKMAHDIFNKTFKPNGRW